MSTLFGCALAVSCTSWKTVPSPFARTSIVPVGPGAIDAAIGDFDGDGNPDLISADRRGLTVLLNQGDGNFAPAPGSPVPVGAGLHLLALADLDRDGDLDVLATGHDHAGVFVWLGNGHGELTAGPGSPHLAHGPEIRAHNHGLAVGDLSGDGVPDVLTANDGDGTASVLLGDGTGQFAHAPGSPMSVGAEPYLSTLADVDGDGFLDAVMPLVGDDALAVLRGDGRGGFAPAVGSPQATLARPYAVVVTDLEGDGRGDVLIAHDDTDRMTILSGAEGGRLVPAVGSPFALGQRVFRMATADFNGDGAIDVVGAAGDRLLVFLAQPGGNFARFSRVELSGGGWNVAIGDLDRDGKPDLVSPDSAAGVLKLWLSSAR
ncbi:VCBS repeat-containing protein [Archangium sp.]|uniref:FG-GAP repeat domain-containing protein n=1 Tax=Archangium sp. TaxID=1872627 RepID=UPI002D57853C|nr:VCBS repeat-containing protein [Archangium sp.]HYO57080.1 VCBS repeat-containing protein [Archangium sp.]